MRNTGDHECDRANGHDGWRIVLQGVRMERIYHEVAGIVALAPGGSIPIVHQNLPKFERRSLADCLALVAMLIREGMDSDTIRGMTPKDASFVSRISSYPLACWFMHISRLGFVY